MTPPRLPAAPVVSDHLPPPHLVGRRVRLTLATQSDAQGLLDFHLRNRDFLRPYLPVHEPDQFTLAYWKRFGVDSKLLYRGDASVRMLVRLVEDPAETIRGQVNLNSVMRGSFQAAYLGYHLDEALQGQGLMREALELSIDWAFGEYGLHRLMANHLPDNHRSAALLDRLGFEIEGYARAYLFIDGRWQDHVLRSRIART